MKILLADAARDIGRGKSDFRHGFLLAAERACRICGISEDEINKIDDEARFGRRIKVGDIVNIEGRKKRVVKVDEPDIHSTELYKSVDTIIDLQEDGVWGTTFMSDNGLEFDPVSGEFISVDHEEAKRRGYRIWEH